jgi:hypothetical protein
MVDLPAELGLQGLLVAVLVGVVRKIFPRFWSGCPRIAKLGVVAGAAATTAAAQALATGASIGSAAGRGAIAFSVGIALREVVRRELPEAVKDLTGDDVTEPNARLPKKLG